MLEPRPPSPARVDLERQRIPRCPTLAPLEEPRTRTSPGSAWSWPPPESVGGRGILEGIRDHAGVRTSPQSGDCQFISVSTSLFCFVSTKQSYVNHYFLPFLTSKILSKTRMYLPLPSARQ